ncbi:Crp/Fnr family transcriptional regulator [Maribius pontilimi]|uniref:Crp/Fnr family transcriptional regulator n=1 Tax=Palleronia pontilimi TaxID=1964209 RepID=A0A934ILM4_9RHOB|nr:Crp/Fnr family transcriptional regulator [Palleronia pontilimi]MBJ3764294.1 Crp/Fnr family transcriptional regulator [Palleronia pontilimi]
MTEIDGPGPDAQHASACRDRLLTRLGDDATPVKLSAGEILFEQGDPADAIFALQDGLLDISALAEDGRKLVLNVLSPGAVFGEVAVFERGTRSATVSARQPSRLVRVGRDVLLSRMRSDPDLALAMVQLAVSRLSWVSSQLELQAFQPLPIRLARRIAWLLTSVGDGTVLPMSQAELADHVGATREAVSKVLTGWRRDGIVKLGRGKLVVQDPDALQDIYLDVSL